MTATSRPRSGSRPLSTAPMPPRAISPIDPVAGRCRRPAGISGEAGWRTGRLGGRGRCRGAGRGAPGRRSRRASPGRPAAGEVDRGAELAGAGEAQGVGRRGRRGAGSAGQRPRGGVRGQHGAAVRAAVGVRRPSPGSLRAVGRGRVHPPRNGIVAEPDAAADEILSGRRDQPPRAANEVADLGVDGGLVRVVERGGDLLAEHRAGSGAGAVGPPPSTAASVVPSRAAIAAWASGAAAGQRRPRAGRTASDRPASAYSRRQPLQHAVEQAQGPVPVEEPVGGQAGVGRLAEVAALGVAGRRSRAAPRRRRASRARSRSRPMRPGRSRSRCGRKARKRPLRAVGARPAGPCPATGRSTPGSGRRPRRGRGPCGGRRRRSDTSRRRRARPAPREPRARPGRRRRPPGSSGSSGRGPSRVGRPGDRTWESSPGPRGRETGRRPSRRLSPLYGMSARHSNPPMPPASGDAQLTRESLEVLSAEKRTVTGVRGVGHGSGSWTGLDDVPARHPKEPRTEGMGVKFPNFSTLINRIPFALLRSSRLCVRLFLIPQSHSSPGCVAYQYRTRAAGRRGRRAVARG